MKPPQFIETERLLLRPPTIADAKSIFAYAQDSEVVRYLTWRTHQSIQETEKVVVEFVRFWESETRYPYAIVLKSKNELVGMIDLRIARFRIEVGYVLARPYWRLGIMTEALLRIVEWAFSQQEIYRVWAVCDVDNIASARVLEKVGMQREGILRRWIIHPNVSNLPRDCYCYAIVK